MNIVFNADMGFYTQFMMDFIMTNCGEVFGGIISLIGVGIATRSIFRSLPKTKCSMLELPNVTNGIKSVVDMVDYIEGDMMSS